MAFRLLIVFMFLEYSRLGIVFDIPSINSVHTFLGVGLFMYSMVSKGYASHERIWAYPGTIWLFILLLLTWISVLTAVQSPVSAKNAAISALGNMFIFFTIVRLVGTMRQLKILFVTLLVVHICVVIFNPAIITEPENRNYLKAAPYFGDGNDFSLSLVTYFPLALFLFAFSKTRLSRIVFLSVMILFVLAVMGTQSRGAFLGLAIVLFYLWLHGNKKMIGAVAIGVLAIVIVSIAPGQWFARMSTLQDTSADGSAQGRIYAWQRAVVVAVERPLTGAGAENFGYVNNGLAAHSIYFKALGELGFPGAIALLAFLFGIFYRNKKLKKKLSASNNCRDHEYYRLLIYLNAGLLGFAFTGAFLNVLFAPHINVIAAIMFLSLHLYNSDKNENENEKDLEPEVKKKNNRMMYYE